MLDDDNEDGGEESQFLAQAVALSRQSWLHFAVALVLLCFVIGSIYGIGTQLRPLYEQVTFLTNNKPENRFDLFGKKITAVNNLVAEDYRNYSDRMQDEAVMTLNKNFSGMYATAIAGERDYTRLLQSYAAAIYEIAKAVRGSGVWYEFFSSDLKELIGRNSVREEQLQVYQPVIDPFARDAAESDPTNTSAQTSAKNPF